MHARRLQRRRKLQRRLPTKGDHHAVGLLDVDDVHDILERERFEIELVGRVVVGGDRFGVAVDHDGLVACVVQRVAGMHAAVVELDALTDAVRTGAEDHDALARALARSFRLGGVVGFVVVGRLAREFGSAGVDGLERGHHTEQFTARAHRSLVRSGEVSDLRIGKSHAFEQAECVSVELVEAQSTQVLLHHDDVAHTVDEPRVDAGGLMHALDLPAAAQRLGHVEDAVLRRATHQVVEGRLVEDLLALAVGVQARAPVFQRAHGLTERFLERAADRHDLANRLHAGGKRVVGALELLEREARHLHDAIVDGRLEAGGRCLGDIVDDLVERVADGQARSGLRDGETGRFTGKRRGTGNARVHLDDDHAPVFGIQGELHVRSARFHADLLQNGQRSRAHALIFDVGKGLRRGDRDGVAGVHAHRVEVLDGADDDAVAGTIAHDLHLEFLPALDRFLDEHLGSRGKLQALGDDQAQLLLVMRDAAAGAAHGEARAQHDRIAEARNDVEGVLDRVGVAAAGSFNAQLGHAVVEQLAIFAALDGVQVAADHLDAVLFQDAALGKLDRGVQARLTAERGKQCVGAFGGDDLFDEFRGDGLDVGAIGHGRVGHDGCGVGVNQHHAVALFLEHLAGLCSRIVELARLADDDGAGADDENGRDVGALRHGWPPFRWRSHCPRRRNASPTGDRQRCRCPGSPRGRTSGGQTR